MVGADCTALLCSSLSMNRADSAWDDCHGQFCWTEQSEFRSVGHRSCEICRVKRTVSTQDDCHCSQSAPHSVGQTACVQR